MNNIITEKRSILRWRILAGVFALLIVLFPSLPYWQVIGLWLFFTQVLYLFEGIGQRIPVRAIFGTLFCLQFFVGPVIAYNIGDNYVIDIYKMQVPQEEYYSYALPAGIFFILGLNLFHRDFSGERLNITAIKDLRRAYPLFPFFMIGIGFATGLVSLVVPADLEFVFYLLSTLKYVGLFMLILSDDKVNFVAFGVVVAYMLGVAASTGMFHDLLTWLIFIGSALFLKYKPSPIIKLSVLVVFGLLAAAIQFIKADYRQTLASDDEANIETMGTVFAETSRERGSMFSEGNIAVNSVRINQGYIISHIMSNVPSNIPFAEGETFKQIIFSAIFPRVIFPDKLNAGDQQIFMKYTGLRLNRTTAMALSPVGDAYVNYGKWGGAFFMFFYGLLFNFWLKFLAKNAKGNPVSLFFVPLIFVFPIRPDCEMQTVLGHLFKSTVVILVILHFFKGKLVSHPVWATK